MADTWIEYKFAVEDIIDRVIVYTADSNGQAYVAYSSDRIDWNYLSGEADHSLTADSELVTASGTSEAQDNYWQLSSGTNIGVFPAMIAGRYMRLYLTGDYTTTIYELVFYREIVAEMAAIDNLAALSANMGTLTAGVIQSDSYGADEGILIDLDNDRIIMGGSSSPVLDINAETGAGTFKGVFTFGSGSSGYSQITDVPTTLSGINSTEGTKLTGIEEGADVTGDNTSADTSAVNGLASSSVSGWSHSSDTTKIDGGDIYTNTITATQITSDTITANEIAADTITANEINVSTLSAISADMGSITAGSIVVGTTNKLWLNDASDGSLAIGGDTKGSAPFRVSATGEVLISSGSYTADPISVAYTAAKCTDADADQTSANIAAAISGQGNLATQDRTDLNYTDGADVTGDNTAANATAYTGASIGTTYTAAKCTDANADQTSTHTANNASNYTGASIGTTYTAAKCTDANADQTSTHTANNASNYTGASIGTTYTAAKCTDANADQTSTHTANNTSNVGTCPASTVQGWRYGSTTYINGGDIYTNTITATQIAANTITATQINVSNLSSMSANMGTITAGTITLSTTGYIRGGQTTYATGTGFFLGYSSGYKFSVGSSTNYLRWNGSTLILSGKIITSGNTTNATAGNLVEANAEPEIYIGDSATAYTKYKEITIAKPGTYRIKFLLKKSAQTTYGRIYRNGGAVGIARSTTSTSYVEFTQDIAGWSKGDLCQFYGKGLSGDVKDFRVCVSDAFTSGVNLS